MPFGLEPRSFKHTVKAFCIISAVVSTRDFGASSPLDAFRRFTVRSGLLSRVIANLANASQVRMVVTRQTRPRLCEKACMHVLEICYYR